MAKPFGHQVEVFTLGSYSAVHWRKERHGRDSQEKAMKDASVASEGQ